MTRAGTGVHTRYRTNSENRGWRPRMVSADVALCNAQTPGDAGWRGDAQTCHEVWAEAVLTPGPPRTDRHAATHEVLGRAVVEGRCGDAPVTPMVAPMAQVVESGLSTRARRVAARPMQRIDSIASLQQLIGMGAAKVDCSHGHTSAAGADARRAPGACGERAHSGVGPARR